MRFRLPLGILLLSAAALAQTSLTVAKLDQFLRSAAATHNSDKDVASYLSHARLSEKLDDATIQQWQSQGIVPPRTLHALWALRDQSASLPAPSANTAAAPARAAIPAPSNEEQAAIIQEVREYALDYSRNLPDFICTEQVDRYAAPPPHQGQEPAWRKGDTLSIRLSYFQQHEQYKLMLVNFRVTDQNYEKVGGSKEFGSFGTLMRGIFEPASETSFHYDHTSMLPGRGVVLAFRYFVDLGHSNYQLVWENSQRIRTAYSGMVWISRDSPHQVLRITVKAENIPADFPIKAAETRLDYDWAELSGHKFLLPSSAEVQMAGDEALTRNQERFAVYRKYSADTEITFDTDPLPPDSPDKNKEIKK